MANFDFQEESISSNLRIVEGTDDADYLRSSPLRQESIFAKMYGGNDKIIVKGGLKNFVNANAGDDEIHLQIDAGGGNYLGGDGNDRIYYSSLPRDEANAINGNKGNDIITGYSGAWALVRGGQGDDYITGAGNLYGDNGFDTFAFPRDGIGIIKDFNVNEDKVYYNQQLGELQVSDLANINGRNGLVLTQGEATLWLENVFSIDAVQMTTPDLSLL